MFDGGIKKNIESDYYHEPFFPQLSLLFVVVQNEIMNLTKNFNFPNFRFFL